MNHRREIDGIRAIAITSVLLFHFFPSALPLGYLGVDLFFVISGYLITCILRSAFDSDTFTFKSFYIRRVRRILPATLVVLLATSVVSMALLIAPDSLRYSASLVAALFFTANIYFWRTGGYFGTNDELKPLLHIWSLGVEEQFYLLFPLALVLTFRLTRKASLRLCIVAIVAIGSFALNTYLLAIGGENPAFFLLPPRAWQFGVGALVALLPNRPFGKEAGIESLALLGFGLIGVNFFYVIPKLPAATMMTVGVGLLSWRRLPSDTTVGRLLTFEPLIFVGLISFSLYLWHWPIVVFLKYVYVGEPPLWLLLSAIVLTFVLAYFSWKYVEEPFRKRMPKKQVFIFVGSMYATLVTLVVVSYLNQGFPSRHTELVNTTANAVGSNYRCPVGSYRSYGGSRACIVGAASTNNYVGALLGNSHAQMYGPAYINALNRIGKNGLIVPLNGCLPTIDINISSRCLTLARLNYEAIMHDPKIKTVIIALTWYADDLVNTNGDRIRDRDFEWRKRSLVNLVRDFERTGRSVFLIGPIAIPGYDFASVASRKIAFGRDDRPAFSVPRKSFDEKYEVVLKDLQSQLGQTLVLPHKLLCDSENCYFGNGTEVFFADGDHLSLEGAVKMSTLFEDMIR